MGSSPAGPTNISISTEQNNKRTAQPRGVDRHDDPRSAMRSAATPHDRVGRTGRESRREWRMLSTTSISLDVRMLPSLWKQNGTFHSWMFHFLTLGRHKRQLEAVLGGGKRGIGGPVRCGALAPNGALVCGSESRHPEKTFQTNSAWGMAPKYTGSGTEPKRRREDHNTNMRPGRQVMPESSHKMWSHKPGG